MNIALKQLSEKVKSYLIRHGCDSLIDKFNLDSEIQIFTTESKSTLAYMNQLSSNIEWHLRKAKSFEKIDYCSIEDIHSRFLFSIDGKSGKYEKPIEILSRINALESNL